MDEQTGQRFVYQDDEVLDKEFDWGQVKRLGKYLKPYSKQILPVIITMMIVGALTKLFNPLLIAYAIDNALREGGDPKLLIQCVGGMLLLYIIQWAANTYRIRFTNQIGQKVIYDLRHDLFSHIQKLSFKFFDKRPAGSILVRITNYVNSLQDLFTNGVVNLLMDCVQLVGIIFILLYFNIKLGAAIIVTVPIMFFISTKLRVHIRRSWQVVQSKQSRINAHLNECIQGIKVTQAFAQEKENMSFLII